MIKRQECVVECVVAIKILGKGTMHEQVLAELLPNTLQTIQSIIQEFQSIGCAGSQYSSIISSNGLNNDEALLAKLVAALSKDNILEQKSLFSSVEPITYFLRRNLEETHSEPGSSDFIINLLLVAMCVTFAGFASGLTQVSQ